MRYQGFIGPSYTLDSLNVDAQECINLFPQKDESGFGKSGEIASLIRTPGIRLVETVGNGPIRGIYRATNGFLFVVSGDKLYYVNSIETPILVGTLLTSSGVVNMADNGSTLVLVDGPNGYWHTFSSLSLTAFTGSEWLGSTHVHYIDGYFLFNDPNSQVFYISNLNSVVIDALDFAGAVGAPDNIVATMVSDRQVWLFGDDSIEAWYNSGNADFPFTRVSGGFMELGCAAPNSVAKIETVVFWIGKSKEGTGTIYAAEGFSPRRISTRAVEIAIQSYSDISSAVAWSYQENGHSFYVLSFEGAGASWVFNLTSGLWHKMAYLNKGNFERHRANCHAFAYGKHYVGDYENGKLYELSSSFYDDAGDEIRRERIAPHISQSLKRIVYKSFELELEAGVGITPEMQGHNPKVMLQYSDDGGHTWSNEKWREFGKIGNRKTRVIWRRLGASRNRVFKIAISDPVDINLIGAEIDVEGLAS